MEFIITKCPECGKNAELMFSNNPIVKPICFDCIKHKLDFNNIEHAEFFCRSYNLPFDPETWMKISKEVKDDCFKQYAALFFDNIDNRPNLKYDSSTADVWKLLNKEWEKCRTQEQVINKIGLIRESYIERASLKWGHTYSFEELLKLDGLYTSSIRANNITNPLQKEAVKMLCKLQVEMNKALIDGDTKAIKDFSSAYATFAKQASLEDMIAETKTDDITTVAELYDYMEKSGFQFKFYDNFVRDEVDAALKDIKESNKRLILESTGLTQVLDQMIQKRTQQLEDQLSEKAAEDVSLQQMLDFSASDMEIDTESNEEITDMNFDEED